MKTRKVFNIASSLSMAGIVLVMRLLRLADARLAMTI
jgi:hypothetical protein